MEGSRYKHQVTQTLVCILVHAYMQAPMLRIMPMLVPMHMRKYLNGGPLTALHLPHLPTVVQSQIMSQCKAPIRNPIPTHLWHIRTCSRGSPAASTCGHGSNASCPKGVDFCVTSIRIPPLATMSFASQGFPFVQPLLLAAFSTRAGWWPPALRPISSLALKMSSTIHHPKLWPSFIFSRPMGLLVNTFVDNPMMHFIAARRT